MKFSQIKSKIWDKKWKYEAELPLEDQFVFIHIPKTAGTTFRFVLYNHFHPKDIYPTQKELKENKGLYLSQKEFLGQKKYANKVMSTGHYHISVVNKMEHKNVKKLAFFRNPIDRILSAIRHIKSFDKDIEFIDVNTALDMYWHRIMHGQCIAMGYNFKKKNIPWVRKNIRKLDFIGITEYFEESIQLCNATFDWELENIKPKNVINQEIFSQLTPHSKMKIIQGLGPELITYNLALKQFKKRCEEHNIVLPN